VSLCPPLLEPLALPGRNPPLDDVRLSLVDECFLRQHLQTFLILLKPGIAGHPKELAQGQQLHSFALVHSSPESPWTARFGTGNDSEVGPFSFDKNIKCPNIRFELEKGLAVLEFNDPVR
jgi:hypothetical protein